MDTLKERVKKRIQLVLLRLLGIFLVVVGIFPYLMLAIVAFVAWLLIGMYKFFTGVPIDWFANEDMPKQIQFHTWLASGAIWIYDRVKFDLFEYEKNG